MILSLFRSLSSIELPDLLPHSCISISAILKYRILYSNSYKVGCVSITHLCFISHSCWFSLTDIEALRFSIWCNLSFNFFISDSNCSREPSSGVSPDSANCDIESQWPEIRNLQYFPFCKSKYTYWSSSQSTNYLSLLIIKAYDSVLINSPVRIAWPALWWLGTRDLPPEERALEAGDIGEPGDKPPIPPMLPSRPLWLAPCIPDIRALDIGLTVRLKNRSGRVSFY